MAKRLLVVSQHFYPEFFRVNDVAFDFAKKGVDVTVICGTPNYPLGQFFKGYSWFKRNCETINGVKIIRVPVTPRGKGSKLQLGINYFSYFISASLYLPWHLLFNKKYDACFVHQTSPVMMSIPGIFFKKLTGKELYTWVLDLWPESLKAAGGITNTRILKFFGLFAKLQYKNSDKILVGSKGYAKNINSMGNYSDRIVYMPNWAEDELLDNEILNVPDLPKGFNVLFAGNVGDAQDFENVVEALRLLRDDENIHFIIVGDGRKLNWIEEQIRVYNLQNRCFLMGRYDIKYMHSFFDKADCLFLSLKDDEIFNITVPAKLQAYMSNGKPIIAMINGDVNELIKDEKLGISVPASSPEDLVEAFRIMKAKSIEDRNEMGRRAKTYFDEHFNKKEIIDNLHNLIFNTNDRNGK